MAAEKGVFKKSVSTSRQPLRSFPIAAGTPRRIFSTTFFESMAVDPKLMVILEFFVTVLLLLAELLRCKIIR